MTLVCFALKEEAAIFQKSVTSQSGISILLTGIGRKNADKLVRKYISGNLPELILTCGFAGGLNPDLKSGEIVFETSEENLRDKLISAGGRPVNFFCADHIATTALEKKQLRRETGADVVEMESAAIQIVCRERKIPCATLRVISDTADEDLPLNFNQLAKPDMNLDYGKLALAIAKSPGKIGPLMRLQKRCRFAAGRLSDVLEKIIQR